jgi:hypothetical protein
VTLHLSLEHSTIPQSLIMGKLTTHDERLSALKARLSGSASFRKATKGSDRSTPPPNPMFPALLHAAARYTAGLDLSPVEQRFILMLKIYSTNEEIAQFGKMYTEMKSQPQFLANTSTLKGTSLHMDAKTPYTDADMIADARANVREILARPENKILDISSLEGDGIDDADYARVLAEAGSGITVITGPEQDQDSSDIPMKPLSSHEQVPVIPIDPGPLYFLKADRFMCHRKQDDTVFGPRNEIYWSFAAGADGGVQKSFKTGEYGEIESGDVRQMNQSFFEGVVHGHLGGHIECWEADDSDSEFYDKMVETLRAIGGYLLDAAVDATQESAGSNWGGSTVSIPLSLFMVLT